MKKAKNASQRKSYKGQEQGGGGSKKLHLQKQTDSAVGSGERMSGQHKHDNKSSVQNKEEVHHGQAADTSSSLQVGTQRKYSQESECKELMTDSIDTEFEMRGIFDCTECRVILKEMIDTHKKKDYYIAKFGDHYYTHAVGCDQMYKGPSGEQKSDIQSHDVKRNTENQLASLPAEAASCHDRAEKNWEYGQNEMAEERSSAGENCQATGEVEDPLSTSNWWHGNKRRNEDNHSRERSDNQRGRQDGGNWGMQDRRKETDNYCRNAYGEGGRRRNMKYEDKGYKIVKEIDGDLFTAPKEWSLAHCVATDMRMGSGIAVTFRQNFKNVGALLEQGARVGHIAVLEHEGRYIYYLVTKRYSTEKPYFEDLVSSLEKMRDHCAENGVKNLAMPRIGCGLDRLEWRDVKPKVEEIFSGLDISITVYNFSQQEKEEDSQYAKKKRHLPVKHRLHSLVNIESETALLFFGSEEGTVDECGNNLNCKFHFLLEYKKQRRTVGDVIRLQMKNEILYGLIIRKKASDAFSYINLEKCLNSLRKFVKSDQFIFIGIEAFYVSDDVDIMEKVISVMKSVLTDPKLELYVCWPKQLQDYCRGNVELKP